MEVLEEKLRTLVRMGDGRFDRIDLAMSLRRASGSGVLDRGRVARGFVPAMGTRGPWR